MYSYRLLSAIFVVFVPLIILQQTSGYPWVREPLSKQMADACVASTLFKDPYDERYVSFEYDARASPPVLFSLPVYRSKFQRIFKRIAAETLNALIESHRSRTLDRQGEGEFFDFDSYRTFSQTFSKNLVLSSMIYYSIVVEKEQDDFIQSTQRDPIHEFEPPDEIDSDFMEDRHRVGYIPYQQVNIEARIVGVRQPLAFRAEVTRKLYDEKILSAVRSIFARHTRAELTIEDRGTIQSLDDIKVRFCQSLKQLVGIMVSQRWLKALSLRLKEPILPEMDAQLAAWMSGQSLLDELRLVLSFAHDYEPDKPDPDAKKALFCVYVTEVKPLTD